MSQVTVITGSASTEDNILESIETLDPHVDIEAKILPTDCPPDELENYVSNSAGDVFIVGANEADTLASYVAAFTDQPVIGVEVNTGCPDDDVKIINAKKLPKRVSSNISVDNVDRAVNLALRIINIA